MKRSGFARKHLPKQHTIHQPIPPGQAGVVASAAGMAQAVPKSEPKRNPALLAMARGRKCLFLAVEACQLDLGATTVAAHQNEGKGIGRKQDDYMSAWACFHCHSWYDQGKAPRAEKRRAFAAAHERQIVEWRKIAADPAESQKNREAAQWALAFVSKAT